MKSAIRTLALILLSCWALCPAANANASANDKASGLHGPYLGQEPPGLTPEVFAPGIISTTGWEINGAFSPDMNEYYFVREVEIDGSLQQQFVVYRKRDNQWHEKVISPRVGQPFISPDGKTLFLGRNYKERTAMGWSEIKSLGTLFTDYRIMSLTASAPGTLVFDEAVRDGKGLIRYSALVNGVRQPPEPFPTEINTGEYNAHPFIAPDESYLIWDGQRNSKVRNANLFISFKQKDGSWGNAIEMGPEINTSAAEFGAKVTPDGKYLLFSRNNGEFEWKKPDGSVESIPNTDIFWVDANVIEHLRKKS